MPEFDYKQIIKEYLKRTFDDLNILIGILLLISLLVSFFIKNFFIDLLPFIFFAIFVFRLLSKNKIQRKKENDIYLKIIHKIKNPFNIDKNHVYKKCKKCNTTLKLPLPKKSGINHVKCPNCGNRITVWNIRHKKKEKVKVEVIKKKKDI